MDYRILNKYRTELMGMAILWVMLFHTRPAFSEVPVLGALSVVGFGGVDIFLVLSCVGLVQSLSRREQGFTQYMGRRAARILPAYYVVMPVYTALLIFRGDAPFSALLWNATLLYYPVRAKGSFNWYVAGIMFFYAMIPVYLRRLERSRHRILWTAGGILLGIANCRLMMADGYWHYIDVFYRIPVFFLGMLVALWVRDGRKVSARDALLWAAWLGLGLVYLAAALTVPEQIIYLPLCHLFLFSTLPMCLTACACFERLPLGWLRCFLRLLGEHSLEIYLFNVSFFSDAQVLELLPFAPIPQHLCAAVLNVLLAVLLRRCVEGARQRWKQKAA